MTAPSNRQLISTGTATEKLAAYSRAVVDGDWIFVSGTIGVDPATGALAEGAAAQARQALAVIQGALARANATFANVVRTRVFIVDRADVAAVSEVLREHFEQVLPANTTVICDLPHPAAKVEIEVTARRAAS